MDETRKGIEKTYMSRPTSSQDSIAAASRWRSKFSGHGSSKGAAGYVSADDAGQEVDFLSSPGEMAIINPRPGGYENFRIGVAWDNQVVRNTQGLIARFFKKQVLKSGIDLDIGCLYQMKNGNRGAVQAFGGPYGALDSEPYIALSGDERTGNAHGHDEMLVLNGAKWDLIERILIYVYIYRGAENWNDVKPQVHLKVPHERPVVIDLRARNDVMDICAVAGIENVRGGIRLKTHMEYYPGQAEMDRAFGFGLEWEQGKKE